LLGKYFEKERLDKKDYLTVLQRKKTNLATILPDGVCFGCLTTMGR
jgi:hypothetical protein